MFVLCLSYGGIEWTEEIHPIVFLLPNEQNKTENKRLIPLGVVPSKEVRSLADIKRGGRGRCVLLPWSELSFTGSGRYRLVQCKVSSLSGALINCCLSLCAQCPLANN